MNTQLSFAGMTPPPQPTWIWDVEKIKAMDAQQLEERRKRTSDLIISAALNCADLTELLSKLSAVFGREISESWDDTIHGGKMMRGASRKAYYMPYALTLKYEHDAINYGSQNDVEVETEKKWSKYVPKVYAQYRSDDWTDTCETGLSIILVEMCPNDKSAIYKAGEERNKRLKKIRTLFEDAHDKNIGQRLNGEWVMIDAGLGPRYGSSPSSSSDSPTPTPETPARQCSKCGGDMRQSLTYCRHCKFPCAGCGNIRYKNEMTRDSNFQLEVLRL